jgi:hypothetical protein
MKLVGKRDKNDKGASEKSGMEDEDSEVSFNVNPLAMKATDADDEAAKSVQDILKSEIAPNV